ncbi:hypothetical protein IC229_19055 [Spirosoma sp. BT702]|uniref:Uncharacterized protein n=1 Tax=Spirosoma profusum TaxID=2771354 RepID=A0A926XXK3_9BACT|nr:hypothetical protein [Spirosoma profusum]MBD2702754.1 hypothetical protein [Spirosoma profusum]
MKTPFALLSAFVGIAVFTQLTSAQSTNIPIPDNLTTIELPSPVSKVSARSQTPAVGFWVVENSPGLGRQTLVHYYADQWTLLQTDSLALRRLNLKNRRTTNELNQRLQVLLTHFSTNRHQLAGPKHR